jgi:hypothetical protein
MLSDLTPAEFAALRSALEEAQRAGKASPPGEISYAELAAAYRTSPQDIAIWERAALEKIRAMSADVLEDFLRYLHV